MKTLKISFDISSFSLHIMAMLFMFCDHLCMTLLGNQIWLHYIGRVAFPIFAFTIVEGYRHTGNLKKYLVRLFVFALISEIPFDLMCGGTWFFPVQQNVLWTFIISILCMLIMDQPKKITNKIVRYSVFSVVALLTLLLGFIIGTLTMVDYFGGGIIMVLIFFLFREDEILSFKVNYKKEWMRTAVVWINRLLQAYFVWSICSELIGGLCENITVFGRTFEVVVEAFGIFALIPIWFYKGRQGHHSKAFKYFCYSFYPAHILILVLIKLVVFK